MRVLIAGCGYVGTALGLELAEDGHEVWGVRRDPAGLPSGIEPVAADLTDPGSLGGLPASPDVIVLSASPDAREAAAYRATYLDAPRTLLAALEGRGGTAPRRVLFTSSTAVYGQREGEWVNEDSATEPRSRTGRILVQAEEELRGSGWPVVVVRFGGIYGPGRTRLVEEVRGGQARCPEDPVFTNRIHRDDCAGVLAHLLRLGAPDPVYCAVDHEPAERCEVLGFIAERVGVPKPQVGEFRSRGGSKRVRNDRLVASGYRFRYPTFRGGYSELMRR